MDGPVNHSSALLDENNDSSRPDYLNPPQNFDKQKRTPQQIEDIWINLRNIPETKKCIYILQIVAAFFALLLLILGIVLNTKNNSTLSQLIIGFSSFALFTFLWGLLAVYQYSNKVDEFLQNSENVNPEDIDQSLERNYLNVFMFLLMFLFLIFGLIAIGSFASEEKILFQIKALAVNQQTWVEVFGDLSYTFVINRFQAIVMTVGTISFIYTFYLGIVIYYIFSMLGFYRAVQTCVQFISIIYFTLGLILLYFSIYASRYNEVTKTDNAIRPWIPICLLVLSVISTVFASSGFLGAYLEKRKILRPFMWLNIVFSVLIIIITIIFFIFSDRFNTLFQENCYTLMDLVPESYLKDSINCSQKYLFSSNSLSKLICPKERIANDWEINQGIPEDQQQTIYGCLDKACCYNFYSYLKNNIDYVAVSSLILFFTSVFSCIGAYIMIDRLDSGDEIGSSHKHTVAGIVVFALIMLISFIILVAYVPVAPKPKPGSTVELDDSPINKTIIPPDQVVNTDMTNSTIKNEIDSTNDKENKDEISKNTIIVEEKAGCTEGSCLSLNYTYTISSYSGELILSSEFSKTNATLIKDTAVENKKDNFSVVSFWADYAIPNFINLIDIHLLCDLNPGSLIIKVTAMPYQKNENSAATSTETTKSFLKKNSKLFKTNLLNQKKKTTTKQNTAAAGTTNNNTGDNSSIATSNSENHQSNQTITMNVIDLSKLVKGQQINVIYTNNYGYSFVQPSTVKVSGNVVDQKGNPISNANVILYPIDFPTCSAYKGISSANTGAFTSDPLHLFNDNLRIKYKLEITKDGYLPYSSYVYIGGFAATDINLNNIILVQPQQTQNSNTNTNIINSDTNSANSTTNTENSNSSTTNTNSSTINSNTNIENSNTNTTNSNSNTEATSNSTQSSTNNQVNPIGISSLVIDSHTNNGLKNVAIKIYKGYKDIPQVIISDIDNQHNYNDNNKKSNDAKNSHANKSFLKLKAEIKTKISTKINSLLETLVKDNVASSDDNQSDAPYIGEVISDNHGSFSISLQDPGLYTFVYSKDGYYSCIVRKTITKDNSQLNTLNLAKIMPNEVFKVTLNWGTQVKDLDLFAMFRVDKNTDCNIFFGSKKCASATLDTDNKEFGNNGGESLTVQKLGSFNYTLAVNKYQDRSNGEISGEFNEETNEYNRATQVDPIDTTPISISNANVYVYSPYYLYPILSISIPETISQDNVIGTYSQNNDYNWWVLFCLDGSQGLNSLTLVNKFADKQPTSSFCQNYDPQNPSKPILLEISNKMKNK